MPAPLDSRLHYTGLSQMSLLRALRTDQYAAEKQRHVKLFGHNRPPM